VARQALSLMHYEVPEGQLSPESLIPAQAIDDRDPCVAACYHCLLSYYNQPLHAVIDRRNHEALNLLCALANGSVVGQSERSEATHQASAVTKEALSLARLLMSQGFRAADAYDLPLGSSGAMAAALYRQDKVLVFIGEPGDTARAYAVERGYTQVVLPQEPSAWPEALSIYAHCIPKIHGGAV